MQCGVEFSTDVNVTSAFEASVNSGLEMRLPSPNHFAMLDQFGLEALLRQLSAILAAWNVQPGTRMSKLVEALLAWVRHLLRWFIYASGPHLMWHGHPLDMILGGLSKNSLQVCLPSGNKFGVPLELGLEHLLRQHLLVFADRNLEPGTQSP